MLLKSICSIFCLFLMSCAFSQNQTKPAGPPKYPDILKVGKAKLLILESHLSEDSLRKHRSTYGRSTTLNYIEDKQVIKIRSTLEKQGITISEVSRMTRDSAKALTDSIFFENMEVRDSSDYIFYITLSEEQSMIQYTVMTVEERARFRSSLSDEGILSKPDAEDTTRDIEFELIFTTGWDEQFSIADWTIRSLQRSIETYEDPRYKH